MWGWDIMPRIVSGGLWRSVGLETNPEIDFDGLYFWTEEITGQGPKVGLWFQFHSSDADLSGYDLKIIGHCDSHVFEYTWSVEFISGCIISLSPVHVYGGQGDMEIRICTR